MWKLQFLFTSNVLILCSVHHMLHESKNIWAFIQNIHTLFIQSLYIMFFLLCIFLNSLLLSHMATFIVILHPFSSLKALVSIQCNCMEKRMDNFLLLCSSEEWKSHRVWKLQTFPFLLSFSFGESLRTHADWIVSNVLSVMHLPMCAPGVK